MPHWVLHKKVGNSTTPSVSGSSEIRDTSHSMTAQALRELVKDLRICSRPRLIWSNPFLVCKLFQAFSQLLLLRMPLSETPYLIGKPSLFLCYIQIPILGKLNLPLFIDPINHSLSYSIERGLLLLWSSHTYSRFPIVKSSLFFSYSIWNGEWNLFI